MRVFVSLVVLLALVTLPRTAEAAEQPAKYFLVTLSSTGDWAADYGNDGRAPGLVTGIGVDGTASTSWSWDVRAVARSVRGGPVTTLRAISRARYDGQWSLVSYSVQQSVYKAEALCTSVHHPTGGGTPESPTRGSFGTTNRPGPVRGRGAWTRLLRPSIRIDSTGISTDVRTGAFLGLGSFGCYHPVDGHRPAFYDGATPETAPVPRGAFNPRFDRSYRKTYVSPLGLPIRHEQVNDPNQDHTTSGSARLTISVKSVTERAARRKAAEYRGRPSGDVAFG